MGFQVLSACALPPVVYVHSTTIRPIQGVIHLPVHGGTPCHVFDGLDHSDMYSC